MDDQAPPEHVFRINRIPGRPFVFPPVEKAQEGRRTPASPTVKRLLPKLLRGSESRRIRTRSRRSYTGDVPMSRIGYKVVSGESLLELDFLLLVDDVMHDLRDVVSQPFELRIGPADASTGWMPDFLLDLVHGGGELVEVKTEEALHPEDPAKRAAAMFRVDAMRKAAAEAGYRFRLATEREIRIQPRLDNARLVHRAMSPFFSDRDMIAADLAFAGLEGELSVSALSRRLPTHLRPFALPLALRLERTGRLAFDRRLAIGPDSRFRRVGDDA